MPTREPIHCTNWPISSSSSVWRCLSASHTLFACAFTCQNQDICSQSQNEGILKLLYTVCDDMYVRQLEQDALECLYPYLCVHSQVRMRVYGSLYILYAMTCTSDSLNKLLYSVLYLICICMCIVNMRGCSEIGFCTYSWGCSEIVNCEADQKLFCTYSWGWLEIVLYIIVLLIGDCLIHICVSVGMQKLIESVPYICWLCMHILMGSLFVYKYAHMCSSFVYVHIHC